SISPITSTPAALANSTVQCGLGCVRGTPGDSTKEAKLDQSSPRRSAVAIPSACAFATLSGLSSHAITAAPPSARARAVASPDPPSPNSATFLSFKAVAGIMVRLPQLEGRKSDQCKHHGDDPEPDHHLALGPA